MNEKEIILANELIASKLELQQKADMWHDEFRRIKALSPGGEIEGICDRAMEDIEAKVSVIGEIYRLKEAIFELKKYELLFREMCEETDGLEEDGCENWRGHFLPYNELLKVMNDAGLDGYTQDPMELVFRLINERDELKNAQLTQ